MKDAMLDFSEIAESYRRLFGCSICFHDYTGNILKTSSIVLDTHMNPFCQIVKSNRHHERKCVEFDMHNIRHYLSGGRKELLKICHAGVLEFVVAVHSEDKLCGAIFIGPYRVKSPRGPAGIFIQEASPDINRKSDKLMNSLELLEDERLHDMMNMARLLAAEFGRTMASIRRSLILNGGYGEKIAYFISREFKNPITIGSLAQFLSLSVSRTSRLVKLHEGKTFPQLLSERRIEHAKTLLENSFFNIETIAGSCGFSDPAYFFRTFKRLQGMTPSEYKRGARRKTAGASV